MSRTCLIIGASGDIGLAIAKKLAAEGYSLILHYNQNKEIFKELPEQSVITILHGDLSTSEGINQFLSSINLQVDSVIFASGTSNIGLFHDTTEYEMDNMLHLHVKAPWMISKHLLPQMIRLKQGNIVMVTSIWGKKGASCEVVYSSVKGAQNTFVKALSKEVGPSGIRVNGISPGFIETKMNSGFSEEEIMGIVEQIPMTRSGKASEVANLVVFLLDAKSSYIHGEVINITGGWD